MRIWTEGSFPAMSPPWWLLPSLPHPLSSWHTPGSGTCFKDNTRKGRPWEIMLDTPAPSGPGSGALGLSIPGPR